MIILCTILFAFVVAIGLCFIFDKHEFGSDVVVFSVIAIICLFFFVVVPVGVSYTNLQQDKANLIKYQNNKQVYTTRANDLVSKFKGYLSVQYPNLEKQVFKNISPNNVAFYFAQYPQLRSSETISKLVDQIRQLRDKIYEQDLNSNEVKKSIYVRQHNPWLINWFF